MEARYYLTLRRQSHESIRNAVNEATPLSMKDIQSDVQSFIKNRVSKNLVFHPNLSGSTKLSSEKFGLIKISSSLLEHSES